MRYATDEEAEHGPARKEWDEQEGTWVPSISEFYGIVISMYYRDHPPPHFHAQYGEFEAIVDIDPIRVIEGRLPRRARGLVFEWVALHQDELRRCWAQAQGREQPNRIAPLN